MDKHFEVGYNKNQRCNLQLDIAGILTYNGGKL